MLGGALAVLLGAAGRRSEAAGATLKVPSLTEWLANDDMDPQVGGTTYYAQPGASGPGDSEQNPGDLQALVTAMSPGDTVVCLGAPGGGIGFYDLPDGLVFPVGKGENASSRYMVMGKRHGDAAVIDRGQEFVEFRTPNSGAWTQSGLTQDQIDKKIWRSATNFGAGNPSQLCGGWIEFGEPFWFPFGYDSLTDLEAAYVASGYPPDAYGGPGAYLATDGHVYVRMQKPLAARGSVNSPWRNGRHLPRGSGDTTDFEVSGNLNYPVTEDPNDYPIWLARWDFGKHAFSSSGDNNATSGYFIVGSGVNSFGGNAALRAAQHADMHRGAHWTASRGCYWSGDYDFNHFFIHRTRIYRGWSMHIDRNFDKFGNWHEGGGSWRGGGLEMDNAGATNKLSDFHMLDSILGPGFPDGTLINPQRCRFRHNIFLGTLDDGLQCNGNKVGPVEWGYNWFYHYCIGGFDTGSGDRPAGEVLFHHNIIDGRTLDHLSPGTMNGKKLYLNHSDSSNVPMKWYNNTLLGMPDPEDTQAFPWVHGSAKVNQHASEVHEVFNNIGVMQWDARFPDPNVSNQRMDAVIGHFRDDSASGAGMFVSADFSGEFWDYNHIYRDVPVHPDLGTLVTGIVRASDTDGSSFNNPHFDTLADFVASSEFETSKASGTHRGAYTPGFMANGVESEPPIPSITQFATATWHSDITIRFDYRPTTDLPGVSTSLSGEDWWSTDPVWGTDYFAWNVYGAGIAPDPWKGALDPAGISVPVGVQNP